jgi:hypothetical protein
MCWIMLIRKIESPKDNPDGIGIEGAIKYLGDIKVQLDEVVCLGIAELLRSPSMGEFTREGFVDGWKNVKYVCSLLGSYPSSFGHHPIFPVSNRPFFPNEAVTRCKSKPHTQPPFAPVFLTNQTSSAASTATHSFSAASQASATLLSKSPQNSGDSSSRAKAAASRGTRLQRPGSIGGLNLWKAPGRGQ